MATKKIAKKAASKQSKADEFIGYALGISVLFMSVSLLMITYVAVMQMKQMGK